LSTPSTRGIGFPTAVSFIYDLPPAPTRGRQSA
jgi:hypothetical protein